MDRGRLVVQDDLATAARTRPGGSWSARRRRERVAALLDGRVEQRDGETLIVRHDDPGALNAELVAAGVTVTAIGPPSGARSNRWCSTRPPHSSDRVEAVR